MSSRSMSSACLIGRRRSRSAARRARIGSHAALDRPLHECCCRRGISMRPSTTPESRRRSSARDRAGRPCRVRRVSSDAGGGTRSGGEGGGGKGNGAGSGAVWALVARVGVRVVAPADRGYHSDGQVGRRRVEHLACESSGERRRRDRVHRGRAARALTLQPKFARGARTDTTCS